MLVSVPAPAKAVLAPGDAETADASVSEPATNADADGVTDEADAAVSEAAIPVEASGVAETVEAAVSAPVMDVAACGVDGKDDVPVSAPTKESAACGVNPNPDAAIETVMNDVSPCGPKATTLVTVEPPESGKDTSSPVPRMGSGGPANGRRERPPNVIGCGLAKKLEVGKTTGATCATKAPDRTPMPSIAMPGIGARGGNPGTRR